MDLKESVYSVLVVSASEKFNLSLRDLLPNFKFSPVCFESSVNAAKRALLDRTFDFVIVNSPLPDDAGLRFAIDICHESSNVVLLFVRQELYASTYVKTAEHGVYLLQKPAPKAVASQAIDWMITTHERLQRLEKKTTSIDEKIREIRIVNRAKCVLIEQLRMTEPEAHRYIEKQAMNNCISKKAVAEDIIKAYT